MPRLDESSATLNISPRTKNIRESKGVNDLDIATKQKKQKKGKRFCVNTIDARCTDINSIELGSIDSLRSRESQVRKWTKITKPINNGTSNTMQCIALMGSSTCGCFRKMTKQHKKKKTRHFITRRLDRCR